MDKDFITWVANNIIENSPEENLQVLKQDLQDEPEKVIQNLSVLVMENRVVEMYVIETCEMFAANADVGDPSLYYTIGKHVMNHLRETLLPEAS